MNLLPVGNPRRMRLPKQRAIQGLLAGLTAFGMMLGAAGAGTNAPAEVVLGMSTALSGPAAALGLGMREGVLAGLERANRAGGVHGRRLRLVALDDGYEPSRAAPNMRQLLEREKVLAVVGNVGTPTAVVSVPIATEQKTLYFAACTGAGVLRSRPPDRYVVNFRASYAEEARAMIDALLDDLGLKLEEIAFFTQRDSYGDAGFNGGIAALKARGLKDEKAILHVRYERNTLAVEKAVAGLVLARNPPRAIVLAGAYAPAAKFIRECRQAGLRTLFLNFSFVGGDPLAQALGQMKAAVVVMQVVPSPLDQDLPIIREFAADLRALTPSARPGHGNLEGYIAARIFIRALESIPGKPTRETTIEALEALGRFDLGLGQALRLGPEEHQASHHVWPTVLRDGAFVPLSWKQFAAPSPGGDVP